MSGRRHATYRWSARNSSSRIDTPDGPVWKPTEYVSAVEQARVRGRALASGDPRFLCLDVEVRDRPAQIEGTQLLDE